MKSSVVQVAGEYSYGYLKAEKGVHRLVRLSPFDADHARHTSFALVEVLPEADEETDVDIDPDDLKIDVFRAGGHGGQSVQKNATAVRITHVPTGIRVSCQNERSQHQNKEIAMRILTARLVEREMALKAQEMDRLKGEHVSAEWGKPDTQLRPSSVQDGEGPQDGVRDIGHGSSARRRDRRVHCALSQVDGGRSFKTELNLPDEDTCDA